jgi:LuxR family transcriptional regulator
MRWAQENAGAIGWGDLWNDPRALTAPERRVVAFQKSMNVVAGYTVSIPHNNTRTFAMASLTGRPGLSQADLGAIWSTEGRTIWTLTNVMHLKVLSLPHRGLGSDLSNRQREALEWVGDGKSYQDIAAIMGVSMATVEKHLRLAREKLRVATTAQALMKAAFQNQIYTVRGSGLCCPNRGPGVAPATKSLTET